MRGLRDAIDHGGDTWESGIVAAAHSWPASSSVLVTSPWRWTTNGQSHRAFILALYGACAPPLLKDMVADLFDGPSATAAIQPATARRSGASTTSINN
jgi:hypothetical protein